MMRPLLLVLAVLLTTGCVGPADPDPQVQQRYRSAAAPLLRAHERLAAYDAVIAEGDYRRAQAMWPDIAEYVSEVVDTYDPAAVTELGPAERSALVGYRGGLQRGLAAWERVDAAVRAQQPGVDAPVEEVAAVAREHMRHLDDLRAGAF